MRRSRRAPPVPAATAALPPSKHLLLHLKFQPQTPVNHPALFLPILLPKFQVMNQQNTPINDPSLTLTNTPSNARSYSPSSAYLPLGLCQTPQILATRGRQNDVTGIASGLCHATKSSSEVINMPLTLHASHQDFASPPNPHSRSSNDVHLRLHHITMTSPLRSSHPLTLPSPRLSLPPWTLLPFKFPT